jgi:hypothetical protein
MQRPPNDRQPAGDDAHRWNWLTVGITMGIAAGAVVAGVVFDRVASGVTIALALSVAIWLGFGRSRSYPDEPPPRDRS